VEYYHELLQIAGGKERMKHHWKTRGFSKPLTEAEIDNLVKEMHKRKTALVRGIDRNGKTSIEARHSPVYERSDGGGLEDCSLHDKQ